MASFDANFVYMKFFFFRLLVFFIFLQSAVQQAQSQNALLWEITGKGLTSPSYLFGTFHLMCKDDIHFSSELQQSLQAASTLYLELDLDEPGSMNGLMAYLEMKNGKTLPDLFSNPSDYNRLEKFFKDSFRVSLQSMNKMKPNVIEAMLYPKLMPCNRLSGVEEELLLLAKKQKKPVKGLETISFQAALFDNVSDEMEAKSLLFAVDSFQVYKASMLHLMQIYKNQQLDQMEKAFDEEPGFKESKERMLYSRNRNWVRQLREIMKNENVFVAVGAGHLVGQEGLIALLKKEGYKLKPLMN